MLTLLITLLRGLAIGVMISAPMGPVGILCIQRTLNKGRLAGLYTGIGAAASDLFYCLITGFGLSFIEEFLERNQNVIQLVGSIVLIAFGIYLWRKNPAKELKQPDNQEKGTPRKDILGGFLFTVSNPLILFLIIGFLGIITGCLGWWWLITFFVNKVRRHFNVRSMWLVNRIIAGVIFGFAIVGIITSILAWT